MRPNTGNVVPAMANIVSPARCGPYRVSAGTGPPVARSRGLRGADDRERGLGGNLGEAADIATRDVLRLDQPRCSRHCASGAALRSRLQRIAGGGRAAAEMRLRFIAD